MILLEFQFQRVLGDANFGIPYWDWAADGDLPIDEQPNQAVWADDCMGGSGTPVTTGPFAAGGPFQIRIETGSTGQMISVNRPLERGFGSFDPFNPFGLPAKASVAAVLTQTVYDQAQWNASSGGFRNRVEGWVPALTAPHLHNLVHVWVGGDMGPSSSPNDPVFYLNHCNVDRIWQAWLSAAPRTYVPAPTQPASLAPHRRNDTIHSILTATAPTNQQMMNVSQFYTYDNLNV